MMFKPQNCETTINNWKILTSSLIFDQYLKSKVL